MATKADLVEIVARFDPKPAKMAPEGERPEDGHMDGGGMMIFPLLCSIPAADD